jgi:LysM repeat protein
LLKIVLADIKGIATISVIILSRFREATITNTASIIFNKEVLLPASSRGDKGVVNLQNLGFKKVIVSGLILGSSLLCGSTARGQTYYVQPGDSLYLIAARYGTTTAALQQANSLTATTIYAGQAIKILPAASSGTKMGLTYITSPGDSLYLIAKRYGISVTLLKQANNLTSDTLLAGKQLVIPTTTGISSTDVTHQVQAGESLYLIAKQYGVTVDALKAANQITDNSILTGQTLKIPPSIGTTATTGSVTHVIKSGDSIYYIAQKYGITIEALLKANYLSSSSVLYPGQKLTIPAVGSSSSNSSGTVYANYVISQSDLGLFSRLVSAEANGESFAGQVAVAATILNRLTDSRYPKTISEIVYQVVDGYYQYSPVLDGRINEAATASAYQAVLQAIAGWDPSNGANGFYNPDKTTSLWVRSQTITATIGNHVFFSN